MSISIETFGQMFKDFKTIGKDHVFIRDDASVFKKTDGWFSRWRNRVCAFLGCGRDENRAIYDTFFSLIDQTEGLGKKITTAVKTALNKNRYSNGKPLSGRKVVKVIKLILEKKLGKRYVIDQENREILDRCTQNAVDKFGREIIPYAQFLIEKSQKTTEVISEETINYCLNRKLCRMEKNILKDVQTMIQELIRNRSDAEAIEALKGKVLDCCCTHCFVGDMNARGFWINSITLKKLLEQLDVMHKRLGWRVNPADAEKIIPEIRSSYGEDAIPFAREYMSLPLGNAEMLRSVMANLHQRLEKEVSEGMQSELKNMSAKEKREIILVFLKYTTEIYNTTVRPIDKWICRIFLTHIENEMEAPQRPGMNVV